MHPLFGAHFSSLKGTTSATATAIVKAYSAKWNAPLNDAPSGNPKGLASLGVKAGPLARLFGRWKNLA